MWFSREFGYVNQTAFKEQSKDESSHIPVKYLKSLSWATDYESQAYKPIGLGLGCAGIPQFTSKARQ